MSTKNSDIKESLVVCQTSQGLEIRASLLRLTRYLAVFELYNPSLVLRTSEVLSEFHVIAQERVIYAGRAVINNLVSTGIVTVCEAALTDSGWRDVDLTAEMLRKGKLSEQFRDFLQEWQKYYKVAPEYKIIVADIQSYLADLRLWLDQVELGIRASPSEDRLRLEQEAADDLVKPVIPCIDELFEQFETVAKGLAEELLPAHRSYMRRQLHPLVLCSPFAYRTFQKPLGYAGDYEVVNMMVRNQYEGSSLFAKVVNTWFLRQPPAQAHRNRIDFLAAALETETLRVRRQGRPARVFNVACGPAQELQRFISQSPLCDQAQFTVLDFNEETLAHVRSCIETITRQRSRPPAVQYVRKSVQQILKEGNRSVQQPGGQYDLVYCAGLFDYLSDPICQRVMNTLYDQLAPGGLLLGTNVEPSNPLRYGMEHLLDWHLVYRTAAQLRTLAPARAPREACSVHCDPTAVNLFLAVRKPGHD